MWRHAFPALTKHTLAVLQDVNSQLEGLMYVNTACWLQAANEVQTALSVEKARRQEAEDALACAIQRQQLTTQVNAAFIANDLP